jgi:hypothetical protein
VLLVEGYDDLLFYAELLEWLGNGGVYIEQVGGKSHMTAGKMAAALRPAVLRKRAIGVIADADHNPAGTAASLANRLTTITGQQVRAGAWTAGPPRIGFFVVPGADQPGEIESLVWQAWSNDPANAAARACIESYLDCMRGRGLEAHSPDKGRLAAFLAVRNDEDPRLGPGARARVFDFGRPELAPLVEFLRAF